MANASPSSSSAPETQSPPPPPPSKTTKAATSTGDAYKMDSACAAAAAAIESGPVSKAKENGGGPAVEEDAAAAAAGDAVTEDDENHNEPNNKRQTGGDAATETKPIETVVVDVENTEGENDAQRMNGAATDSPVERGETAAAAADVDDDDANAALSAAPPVDFPVTVHDDNLSREGSAGSGSKADPSHSSHSSSRVDSPSRGQQRLLPPARRRASSRRRRRRRLRGARPRVAPIANRNAEGTEKKVAAAPSNDNGSTSAQVETKLSGLPVPSNQYECLVTRRAVLPRPPPPQQLDSSNSTTFDSNVYGDTSLGMKLSVADSGAVIVQRVTALRDGRASPAQLTGLIRRGDVLVAIDGAPLTARGVALLAGLQVLQAPEDPTVPCQRAYRMRLAAGAGLDQLRAVEEAQRQRLHVAGPNSGSGPNSPRIRRDPVGDLMLGGIFPMVDQLSGLPYFDEATEQQHQQQQQQQQVNAKSSDNSRATTEGTSDTARRLESSSLFWKKRAVSADAMNELISESLAHLRVEERNRYLEYAIVRRALGVGGDLSSYDYYYSDIGEEGKAIEPAEEQQQQQQLLLLTLPQRQELGRRGIVGARNLLKQIENIDAGKDLRSFQNWNTTLSLYSRASTRRRRVFDAASLPLNFGKVDEGDDEEENDGNSADGGQSSANSEQVDGDELLLRLAAHDVIWRKQVIEFLEKVALEWESEDADDPKEEKTAEGSDLNAAMSNELGNFLFGENMTKILAKNKKPRSLPSEEVTAVLFDLATELSASVPDEIKATQSTMSSKSGLTPFAGFKRQPAGSDVLLATRFLLDEALPAWLKSFRPLVWEHRRILWPVNRIHMGGSTAASTLSDDLTMDSMSIRSTNTRSSPQQHRPRKTKTIREIIEDQELNVETRAETCFLVTYYFIHAMLPRLMRAKKAEGPDSEKGRDEIVVFMGEYGSYLKMDTCLAYAAVLKADSVVDILLSIAKYDPRHREVIKQTSKSTSMVFYEPSMLSAVVQLLYGIEKETNRERKRAIIDLSTAAYPDLRPWQAKKACDVSQNTSASEAFREEMRNWYYSYLTLLLDPMDGHDAARRDPSLVKEWCELSVNDLVKVDESKQKEDRRTNFFYVASRTASHHLAYHRDLLLLLSLSMKIKECSLALDLAGEIIDNPKLARQDTALKLVLEEVRLIGLHALDAGEKDRKDAAKTLKRILRLFEKPTFRRVVDVSRELQQFFEHRAGKASVDVAESNVLELVGFVAEEAIPSDVLKGLSMVNAPPSFQPALFPVLHTVLKRGASSGNELSASLLRIKQSRRRLEGRLDSPVEEQGSSDFVSQKIWKKMSSGMVAIEK